MSGGDDQERLQRLKTRKRELVEEERELETQINEIEKRIRLEKEAQTPNVPLSTLHTKKEVQDLLNVYTDYDLVLLDPKSKFTLQGEIDAIVCDIEDCQCSIYYNVKTRNFQTVKYKKKDSMELCDKFDKHPDFARVFAK